MLALLARKQVLQRCLSLEALASSSRLLIHTSCLTSTDEPSNIANKYTLEDFQQKKSKKKWPSGYDIFRKAKMSGIHQDLKEQGINGTEAFKQAAGEWRALSESDKRPFQVESKRLKKEYLANDPEYQKKEAAKNPYQKYMTEMMSLLADEHPGLSSQDRVKALNVEWKKQKGTKAEASSGSNEKPSCV